MCSPTSRFGLWEIGGFSRQSRVLLLARSGKPIRTTSSQKGAKSSSSSPKMTYQLSDYLGTDDLTILLALIAATVFLLANLYKPQPLVHPILLGRQSDVGRARNPGESAVYRNYSTGLMGRVRALSLYPSLPCSSCPLQFPLRPGKDVHILPDLVRSEVDAPRTLWSTKVRLFGFMWDGLAHTPPQLAREWRSTRSCSGIWHGTSPSLTRGGAKVECSAAAQRLARCASFRRLISCTCVLML